MPAPILELGSFSLDLSQVPTGMINVKNWGPNVGSGAGDDYAAIAGAIAAAQTTGMGLYFPKCPGYRTLQTVTIPVGIPVLMDAPIIYAGGLNVPALVVGTSGQANFAKTLRLAARRATTSDWTDEGSIGIQVKNANTVQIEIVEAVGFTIGVQFIASGQGFSYNTVKLGYIIDNKIQVDLTGETNGWCNENLYLGGRLTCSSTANVGSSRYGVRITSKDGSYTAHNNNQFLKPNFELSGNKAAPGECIAILIEHGQNNQFWMCRNEGNYHTGSTTFARIKNAATENRISCGYGYVQWSMVDDQSSAPTTTVEDLRTSHTLHKAEVFNTGSLAKKACYYDGATKVHIPGVFRVRGSGGTFSEAEAATLAADYVEPTGTHGSFAVWLNTSLVKRFIIKRSAVAGRGGRAFVIPYDAAGNRIAHDPAAPAVRGSVTHQLTWFAADKGGSYGTGADSTADCYFVVTANVAKVVVGISNGSQTVQLKAFSIVSVDGGSPEVWSEYQRSTPMPVATTPPTAGTWPVGFEIRNAAPAAGQPMGWVCTAAGTPGTWRAMPNL